MTRRRRRIAFILSGLAVLGLALALVLFALSDNIVFFHTPSDVADKHIPAGQRFRLGGLVAQGSLVRGAGTDVQFTVTDTKNDLRVTYRGVLPDLFREGQGVVAEGRLEPDGRFRADTVLAKHDETYMPPDVAKALKAQGVWHGAGTAPGGTPAPVAKN